MLPIPRQIPQPQTDEKLKLAVWNKCFTVPPELGKIYNPKEWRIDSFGSKIFGSDIYRF